MSETDFERAQFDDPRSSTIVCRLCDSAPGASYYSLNGHNVCPTCLDGARAGQKKSSFLKALALGIAAGAVGAVVYYGIRLATGYDLALITILLGSIVGVAVRRGAGGSQSALYRVMAVAIAWIAMSSTYVPLLADALNESVSKEEQGAAPGEAGAAEDPATPEDTARARSVIVWGVSAVLSLGVPLLFVMELEVLGLIIFGVGLWEAWRRSAAPPFVVTGPFGVASA
jgi:hypothetical protein